MERFLQTLMEALAVGSLYALIALGYTMVYGILKFINFAHSDVFVLGAWVSFTVASAAGFGAVAAGQDAGGVPIAPWVFWAAGILAALAVGSAVYERVLAKGRARTRVSGPLILGASWAWALIALVFVIGALRGQPALAVVAGGLILVLAMGTCGLVGFGLERLAYKPLRKAPRLNVLITAIGVSLLLQNTGQLGWMFGTRPQGMPQLVEDRVLNRTLIAEGPARAGERGPAVAAPADFTLEAGRRYTLELTFPDGKISRTTLPAPRQTFEARAGQDLSRPFDPAQSAAGPTLAADTSGATARVYRMPRVPIRLLDVLGAGTAIVLMILLDRLVFHTRVGRAMRAVSHNPQNAALMGIDVDKVISFTFVLGAMLAAAAGFLYGQKYGGIQQPAAALWVLLGLKAFVAAVVGGIGNIRGAMLGGILIGLLEFFVATYVPDGTQLRDIFVFGLLIAVLLFKPSGILGKSAIEKV